MDGTILNITIRMLVDGFRRTEIKFSCLQGFVLNDTSRLVKEDVNFRAWLVSSRPITICIYSLIMLGTIEHHLDPQIGREPRTSRGLRQFPQTASIIACFNSGESTLGYEGFLKNSFRLEPRKFLGREETHIDTNKWPVRTDFSFIKISAAFQNSNIFSNSPCS